MERLHLSARGYHRVLRLAHSFADLGGEGWIGEAHLGAAIQLRCLNRPL